MPPSPPPALQSIENTTPVFVQRKLQEAVAAKSDEDRLKRLASLGGAVIRAGAALTPEHALVVLGHLLTARVGVVLAPPTPCLQGGVWWSCFDGLRPSFIPPPPSC